MLKLVYLTKISKPKKMTQFQFLIQSDDKLPDFLDRVYRANQPKYDLILFHAPAMNPWILITNEQYARDWARKQPEMVELNQDDFEAEWKDKLYYYRVAGNEDFAIQ